MSLLKNFSPQRTRSKGHESPDSKIKLAETRVGPVLETSDLKKADTREEMIKDYSYKKEGALPEQKTTIAPVEQPATPKPEIYKCPPFGLYELLLKCEERLIIELYGPKDISLKIIDDMNKKLIQDKLEAISETRQEIELESFKDNLYYFGGEVIITEDYKPLTGFLREYFGIENIYIFYNSGELILEECGYCSFWNKRRLKLFFDGNMRELSHTEIQDEHNCLKCIWNSSCPFSRVQQMTK